MRMAILGFALGAAWFQMQAALPSLAWLLAVLGVPPVWIMTHRWLRPAWRGVMALLFGALMGLCWGAWLAHCALAPQLAQADEGQDIKVIGTIDNLPYRFSQGVRFNFAVERPADRAPPKIALSWYSGYRDQVTEVPDVQPGERWQLTVRLQRPHGNDNPYNFDYEAWLLEQGLRATGYVRVARDNQRLDSFVFSVSNAIEQR